MNHKPPTHNQLGFAQIILPLFLLAAIGLTVYLLQQQTELTPSAQTVPDGCSKITPVSRSVCYKKSKESPPEKCKPDPELDGEPPHDEKDYPIKEVTWTFSGGWKNIGSKGANQAIDGDRYSSNDVPSRFDSPSGKSYEKIDSDRVSDSSDRIAYRVKGGQSVVAEFAFSEIGKNFQGITTNPDGTPARRYDKDQSYALVPNDENSNVRCDGEGSGSTTTGSKKSGEKCSKPGDCQSGSCTNEKCDATGTKAGGANCQKGPECQSGTCSNGKCAGGSRTIGQSCDGPNECASNRCVEGKCVSAAASPSPGKSPSPAAKASAAGGATGTAPGASTVPGTSPAPSASTVALSVPATSLPAASAPPGAPIGASPTSLTKAEITGFKRSFDALYNRLGITKDTGNLKVVSTIANSELTSIVSQLPTCPDDANVGKCLDDKFRTRFDFAKTAARLSAFYAIFNNVSGLCVKSDFGLNPLITATAANGAQGRVNLCTEPTASRKIWKAFVSGKFDSIVLTDSRWPVNPTCATLPQDVLTHYRSAEKLFNTQAGFVENTLCDGKTTVAPGGTM